MDGQQIGAVITAIGTVGVVAALVTAHVLPTGLRPWRDPVSQYGISRARALYLTAGLSAAVAAVGAILVLTALFGSGATVPVVLLAIFAVTRAIIPFVPMDAPETPKTGRGRAHNLLAFAAFASVTVAAYLTGGPLHDAGLATAATWSTVCAVVMTVGSLGVLLSPAVAALRRVFGAVERLIYLGFIAWFVVIVAVGVSA